MSLKELFETEYKIKTREIVTKFKRKINLATSAAKEKAVKIYIAELLTEREDTFFHEHEPNKTYFYIDNFTRESFDLYHGLYNDFDLEFAMAKQKVLDGYKDHEFLTKVKLFFKQSDQEIVTKIAHYKAYMTAWEKLERWGQDLLIEIKVRNQVLSGANKNPNKLDSTNIKEAFGKLFKGEKSYNFVLQIINDHLLDENGNWVGYKNKAQEPGAFIDLLSEKGYITSRSKTNAVSILCKKFNIRISDGSKRSKGFAYDDFITFISKYIPYYIPEIENSHTS